ncbi:hypothetical protein AVEN_213764-1 [Araneus ventricosus]|uniref:RNase H type-1 domain-containing protein n=1 Tax=Araneus ventricosus TaxID=182803 RepID=A0A4Y2VFZ3_ARAVE|nr:hypothetical protein AVEN_213764-1 [Araneus ventricosus]
MKRIKWSGVFRLAFNDEATDFIAEAVAILKSVIKAAEILEDTYIFTDSRSVLMALESKKNESSIIKEIKNLLKENLNIEMCWVKAHVGITGNEEADRLAKSAIDREEMDFNIKHSIMWFKKKLKILLRYEWQDRWEKSLKSRFPFGLMPENREDRCLGNFYINQILTKHGCFPEHQSRFFGKTADCDCGLDLGTVTHYIYGCPNFVEIGREFFPGKFATLGILELIHNKKAEKGPVIIVKLKLIVKLS